VNDQTAPALKIGVVSPDVLLSYDGLSFLKAMIAGELPAPPIMQTIGFMLAEVESGRAVFRGTPEFRHYNPIGSIHAGFAATLLDSAMACAVHSTLAQGEAYTTLEFKLNLVRALTDKVGPVTAEGLVLHRGRTIATAEGYLKDAGGKLYAHANTTCVIFPAKA
jgi:uncharacterized protein (TIGR00369 family)